MLFDCKSKDIRYWKLCDVYRIGDIKPILLTSVINTNIAKTKQEVMYNAYHIAILTILTIQDKHLLPDPRRDQHPLRY